MKRYIAPTIICVDLRQEETIADSQCTGSCTIEEAIKFNLVYQGSS